eukprot:Sspe_Gene.23826::Locus_9327_Transcript_1_1_Confidence_1.000_Length_1147::g.23826::m.23826/K04097/HPGDS; prostaglandin-H2 D-isomerase / glutathione transferase
MSTASTEGNGIGAVAQTERNGECGKETKGTDEGKEVNKEATGCDEMKKQCEVESECGGDEKKDCEAKTACFGLSCSPPGQKHPGAPRFRLLYFPFPGRAEAIRLCFLIGKIRFVNECVPPHSPEWEAMKYDTSKIPLQRLPVLYIDDVPYGQSLAQLRYVGRLAKYEGKPLYPDDPLEALKVDEKLDTVLDFILPFIPTFTMPEEEREPARRELIKVGGMCNAILTTLDRALEGSTYLTSSLSIADLKLFSMMSTFRSGNLDGIPKTFLHDFPNIMRHRNTVAMIPTIRCLYKRATGIRAFYRPDGEEGDATPEVKC